MLIIGCGDIGAKVAEIGQKNGHKVLALVRSNASADQLQSKDISPLCVDLDTEKPPAEIDKHNEIYYFAPPPPSGQDDPRISKVLSRLSATHKQRIVYISTTGVYGNCNGEWVDEERPANPQVDRSKRRWSAEQQLRQWQQKTGGEIVILRVAGIYGPNKLPLARLQKQVPIIEESAAPWTNRIHSEDLAAICWEAMRKGGDGEVYNVSDGAPGNMTDYFNQVADATGLDRPPIISTEQAQKELSAGMLSYLGESRRMNNKKLLRDLGIELKYPNLKAGLAASL